ncbi:MAG: hypothetical protein K0S88_4826 [Actinomycetia bacterium]|jgi:hypothetical protein|nr:hypothetical protein [Actinomycetes bacterium]
MTSNGPTVAEQPHTSGRDALGKPASHSAAGAQRLACVRGRR